MRATLFVRMGTSLSPCQLTCLEDLLRIAIVGAEIWPHLTKEVYVDGVDVSDGRIGRVPPLYLFLRPAACLRASMWVHL